MNEADEIISQLNQSRIETTRGYLNNESHGELPSSENPFNPILSYDVQYYEPRLQERRKVLNKYENKENFNMDIALYNTRTHALNAEDVSGLDNLQIHKSQMERARSKVQQRYEDYIPQENSNAGVFNADIYNPGLPISATNQPTQTYSAGFVDERLGYFTNGREFRYPSDIANNAYNLQRSPDIIERNRRQAEADDALFHRHQKSRWVEPKQAYRDRKYDPHYDLNEFVKHDASKANDRQTGNIERENFNTTIKAKHLVDVENLNKVKVDVNQSFQPEYSRHQIQQTMKRFNDAKDPLSRKSNNVINEAFTPTSTKSGLFSTFAEKMYVNIVESLRYLFGVSTRETHTAHPDQLKRNNYANSPHSQQTNLLTDNSDLSQVFERFIEKFEYKPKHLLMIRDGQVPAVYPDEDYSNTAPAFISRDPFDNGLVRTIVLFEDNKFKILQKHENDKIFRGDNRPFGEDYLQHEIPIEDLPPPMRERIKQQNLNTKRDKTLELTYNDFIAFSDYVVKHIDTTERVKFADIWRKIRGNNFDEQLVNNFEGRRTLVDSSTVEKVITDGRKIREHDPLNERIYSQHVQVSPIEQNDLTIANASPIATANLPSTGEAFRPTQLNNTPFATTRTNGANLRKFNA